MKDNKKLKKFHENIKFFGILYIILGASAILLKQATLTVILQFVLAALLLFIVAPLAKKQQKEAGYIIIIGAAAVLINNLLQINFNDDLSNIISNFIVTVLPSVAVIIYTLTSYLSQIKKK